MRRHFVLAGQVALGLLGAVSLFAILQFSGVVDFSEALTRPAAESTDADGTPDPTATLEPHADPPLVISEIAAAAGAGFLDDDGEISDWIELYNPGDEAVDATGLHLSDDPSNPTKWQLPELAIPSGGHVVVWASGKGRRDPAAALHANFALDQTGEEVLLVDADGRVLLDRIEAVELPPRASYGLDPSDPQRNCFFAVPEPGAENRSRCFDAPTLGAPTFSVAAGFHDGPISLEINAEAPTDTILYTLDGSYPDLDRNPERTFVYEGPLRIVDRSPEPERLAAIPGTPPAGLTGTWPTTPTSFEEPIPKATVVRARVEDGAEAAATYFIGPAFSGQQVDALSLVFDEAYLFGHEAGIYVPGRIFEEWREGPSFDPEMPLPDIPANYAQRGGEWERPWPPNDPLVLMHHCPAGGACDFESGAGLRIHGGATRAFPQKSLRLYARGAYGASAFEYPFFGLDGPTEHRRLILRNSGNDNIGLGFLDAFLHTTLGELDVTTQGSAPVVVFLNGEYWGLYHLRERLDEHYFEIVHGVDSATVDILEGGLALAEEGLALLQRIADGPMGEDDVELIEAAIDVESFFDFVATHVYLANGDWPGNNERLWRATAGAGTGPADGPGDGRWRWMVVDLDQIGAVRGAFDWEFDVLRNRFAPTDDPAAHWGSPFLFHRLMEVPQLRERYLSRAARLANTSFAPERLLPLLDAYVADLEGEVPTHLRRWDRGLEGWDVDLGNLREFLTRRPDVHLQQLVDRFDLPGTARLTVATERPGGFVRLDGLTVDGATAGAREGDAWLGTWFQGVPIRLEAVPYEGYEFVRWEGLPADLATDPVVETVLDGDLSVTAVFRHG